VGPNNSAGRDGTRSLLNYNNTYIYNLVTLGVYNELGNHEKYHVKQKIKNFDGFETNYLQEIPEILQMTF
jgi:hypothetical protein